MIGQPFLGMTGLSGMNPMLNMGFPMIPNIMSA
jgi:hypothetical protein